MSLVKEVERILGALVQEVHQDASVLVQFAAGDWFALKQAFLVETGQAEPAPAPEETPAVVEEAPVVESTPAEVTPAEPAETTAEPADAPIVAGDEAVSAEASESLAQAD